MSDFISRKKIIRDTETNFFVEAGAGSGKTTVLVERMVAMVENGIPVEKICTITFTKAAANEFYERFQRRLIERSRIPEVFEETEYRLPKPTEETALRCQEALQNIDLCFMGTIDSFCNMILSEHPAEARIPSGSSVIEEEKMKLIYLQEYSQIQRGNYGKELQDLGRIFSATRRNPNSAFVAIIADLLDVRDAKLMYSEPESYDVNELFKEKKETLLKVFEVMLTNPNLAYERGKTGRTGKETASDEGWRTLEEKNTLLSDDWNSRFPDVLNALEKIKNCRFIKTDHPEEYFGSRTYVLKEYEGRLKCFVFDPEYFDGLIRDLRDYQSQIAMKFADECLTLIPEKLRKEGKLSFFDYKLYLRDMLKEDAENGGKLIDHIYRRHSYFLIDEFQDTDPMQAEIFFYLAAEKPDPKWQNCIPHKGSLFIVGDPKQSIYRFKNADVASFQKVRSLFCKETGEVLQLTANFRSTALLRRWFNEVFTRLLPENTADQSRFEEIPVDSFDEDEYVTGVYKYLADTGKKAEEENKDEYRVLELVRQLVNNPEIRIDQGRMIGFKDIMIITKGKPAIEKYTKVFTENGIPFKVEGNINFNECPALLLLTALFKAVTVPENNLYLYGVLTSDLYGYSSAEMAEIAPELAALRNTGILKTANTKYEAVFQELAKWNTQSRTLSPSALFAKLIDESKVFGIAGSQNSEYVYYILELLRTAEANNEINTHQEAVDYLDELLEQKRKLERCASLEKSADRIHIANLHKVKGLEAPVVILANPTGRERTPQKRVEHKEDQSECYVFRIDDNFFPVLSLNKDTIQYDLEQVSASAEETRLLYVAATRAKNMLIIAEATGNSNPWYPLLGHRETDFFETFCRKNPNTLAARKTTDARALYSAAEKESVLNSSAPLNPCVTILRPSELSHTEYIETEYVPTEKRDPALIGTLVHRLMELLVMSKKKIGIREAIQSLTESLDREDSYYADILHSVAETMLKGGYPQQNEAPQDILNELLKADEVYCELPFSYREKAGNIWTGVIDVLYRKDDEWTIIDYKTNAERNGLDEMYREQLLRYSLALEQMLNIKPKAYIYHIDI